MPSEEQFECFGQNPPPAHLYKKASTFSEIPPGVLSQAQIMSTPRVMMLSYITLSTKSNNPFVHECASDGFAVWWFAVNNRTEDV